MGGGVSECFVGAARDETVDFGEDGGPCWAVVDGGSGMEDIFGDGGRVGIILGAAGGAIIIQYTPIPNRPTTKPPNAKRSGPPPDGAAKAADCPR